MLIPDEVDCKGTSCPSLIREDSLYAGKQLSDMHLNELVKNAVCFEEVNNLLQNPCSSASSSSSSCAASPFLIGTNVNLNKKTIDEFWGEIVDQECANNAVVNPSLSNKRQLAIGNGTTLEEFLVRAGDPSLGNNVQGNPISNPQPLSVIDPMMLENHLEDWMKFQMNPCTDQQQPRNKMNLSVPIDHDSQYRVSDIGQVLDAGFLDNRLVEMPVPLQKVEATSSESHFGGERKRHYPDEMMERRKRRMIKNRESAARSRAKKQAYTKKLQTDVEQLKEKNNWLRRQKELQVTLFPNPPSEPKYQLRRTSSAEL